MALQSPLVAVSIVLLALALGCCGILDAFQAPPAAYNLTFSESIRPYVTVYVVDTNNRNITLVESQQWFYPVQRGLPNGTVYGFRLVSLDGSVVVPVNENFTAQPPPAAVTEMGIQQYHGFAAGNYTIQVVAIRGSLGIIMAKTNITIYNANDAPPAIADAVARNCSAFIPQRKYVSRSEPNASLLYDCIRDLAVVENDPNVCKGLRGYFNDTMWIEENCLIDVAEMTGNISACSGRMRILDTYICRAEILNDWHECQNMECDLSCAIESKETKIDLCIQGYGISNDDEDACNHISDEQYRLQCLGLVTRNMSICRKLINDEARDSCIKYVQNDLRYQPGG